jgi:hypothetical protein
LSLARDAASRHVAQVAEQVFWLRGCRFEAIVFHHRLFEVKASVQASMASRPTAPVQVLMASALMGLGETAKMAPTLEALASALEDLAEPYLGRLQAAKRQVAPARLFRPAWPRAEGSDKLRATS